MRLDYYFIGFLWLIFSYSGRAHPADTSGDGRIQARELASYSTTSPSADLLQQASNIYQLGDDGAYETISLGAGSIHRPVNPAYQFVSLESYAAAPLSEVNVAPLPAIQTSYIAYFSLPSDLATHYPLALEGSQNSLSFRVPLLPQFLTAGGTINLFINREGGAPGGPDEKQAGQFKITPYAANTVPNGLSSYQAKVNQLVSRLEVVSGLDYSNFFVGGSKRLSSVSDPYDRLEIGAVCLLQDPNLEGSVPHTLNLLAEEPGLSEAVEEPLDILAGLATGRIPQVIDQFQTQFRPPIQPSPNRRRSTGDTINTPQELFDQMLDAEVALQMLDDPMFSPSAGAANTALGFAGLPGKVISGSIGLTTAVLQFQYSRRAYQNPSSAKVNATFSKTTFYQDECNEPGMWSATLSAESKEWNVDKSLLDLVLGGVGALQAAGDVAKVANALGKSGDVAAARNALNQVESFNGEDVDLAAGTFTAAETAKSIKDSAPSSNFITLPKKTWTGINGDETTLELRANPDNLSITGRSFEPTQVGSTAVVLAVRSEFYSVGVDSSDLVNITLEEAKAMMMGCPDSSYEPGQVYTLQANLDRVADASTGRFSWEVNAGMLSEPTHFNGVSTVRWTAPDPAPSDVITITAKSTTPLCLPPNTPGPEVSCIVQRLQNYRLNVSPMKECYEPGDVVSLEMENIEDPADDFQANFQLAAGIGILTPTSATTATFTVNTSTNATIAATVVDSPNIFESVVLPFGCGPFEVSIFETTDPVHPWLMSLTIGDTDGIIFQIPGFVTDEGDKITFEFTAQTHRDSYIFQEALNNYPDSLETYEIALENFQNGNGENPGRAPDPPEFGDVGLVFFDTTQEYEDHADLSPYNDSEFIYNDPTFNFTISFDYTRVPGEFNIPGIFETNTLMFSGEPVVTTNGVTGNYALDPIVPVLENNTAGQIGYTISFVPAP